MGSLTYPSPIIDKVKIKSTVEQGKNLYDMYYAPRRRIVQYLEIIDLIDSLKPGTFSSSGMNSYFRTKFWSILALVSWGWRAACSNYEWQSHYAQKVRHIGRLEVLRNEPLGIWKVLKATKLRITNPPPNLCGGFVYCCEGC